MSGVFWTGSPMATNESPAYLNRWAARVTPMPDYGIERCSPSHEHTQDTLHTPTYVRTHILPSRFTLSLNEPGRYDLVTREGTPWNQRRVRELSKIDV